MKTYITIIILLLYSIQVNAGIVNAESILNLTITNSTIQINTNTQSFLFDNRDNVRQFKIVSQVNISNTTEILIQNNTVIIEKQNCENQTAMIEGLKNNMNEQTRKMADDFTNTVTSSVISPRRTLDEVIANQTQCQSLSTSRESALNQSISQIELFRNESLVRITSCQKETLNCQEGSNHNFLAILILAGTNIGLVFMVFMPSIKEKFNVR